MNKPYFCRNVFLTDWRHKRLKNKTDLLFYTENTSMDFQKVLKSDSPPPKKFVIICFNDSPSKMMKKAFYFILKAHFFLKIFKFLSWHFEHVEKTAWLEG